MAFMCPLKCVLLSAQDVHYMGCEQNSNMPAYVTTSVPKALVISQLSNVTLPVTVTLILKDLGQQGKAQLLYSAIE
jgi:hypothetical protein